MMPSWTGSADYNAPVFEVVWPDGSNDPDDRASGLPDLIVSDQLKNPTPTETGRRRTWYYARSNRDDGSMPFIIAARYYEEGMACDPATEHDRRIRCFRAAEIMFLHAAVVGHRGADCWLGHIYEHDRCEGWYWKAEVSERKLNGARFSYESLSVDDPAYPSKGMQRPHDREGKAFWHYRRSAEFECASSGDIYKYGDMLRDGIGCKKDLEAAFTTYARAYEKPWYYSSGSEAGSAALRMGRAFEFGEGCEQSFEKAYAFYEEASARLEAAVKDGEPWPNAALRRADIQLLDEPNVDLSNYYLDVVQQMADNLELGCPAEELGSWYAPSLRKAKNGVRRMRQELDGRY